MPKLVSHHINTSNLERFLKKLHNQPLTASEVAVYLGLSVNYIYRIARNKKIPAIKLANCRWMFRKHLIDMLKQNNLRAKRTKYFNRYFNNKTRKG